MPVTSVKELVAMARKRPGEINYASAGVGSNVHLTTELFKYMAKIDLTAVSYKGGGPATIAVISGEVPLVFTGILTAIPFMKSGHVRALAVTTKQRTPALPDIPTIDESGVPGYDKGRWTGMFAPARVPESITTHVYGA
jgi:tripartite-type tricarboxylate transporter receptor subunit TctC